MAEVPQVLKNNLKTCRRDVTMAKGRKISLENAQDLREKLVDLHEQLYDFYDDDVPDDEVVKMDRYLKTIDDYIDQIINNNSGSGSTISENNIVDNNDIQSNYGDADQQLISDTLPRVNNLNINNSALLPKKISADQLQKFNGKFTSWRRFKRVVEDIVIPNHQIHETIRISTLLNALEGEPFQLVDNLAAEGKSLNEIWSKLVDKYDNSDTLIVELRDELRKFPIVKSNIDLTNLKLARDITAKVAATISLSRIHYLACTPLIQQVANRMFHKAKYDILSDMQDFKLVADYINNLYMKAENFDRNNTNNDTRINQNQHSNNNQQSNHSRANRRSVASINNSSSCVFCSDHHPSKDCNRKSRQEMVEIIRNNRICIRCLKNGHTARQCNSRVPRCTTCNRGHVSELHDVALLLFSSSAATPSSSSNGNNNNQRSTVAAVSSQNDTSSSSNQPISSSTGSNSSPISTTNTDNRSSSSSVAAISSFNQTISTNSISTIIDQLIVTTTTTDPSAPSSSSSICALNNINEFVINKGQICGTRPMLMGQCNGKNCKMLIDFGSELSLIHSSLVNLNGEIETGNWYAGSPLHPNGRIFMDKKVIFTITNNNRYVKIPILITDHLDNNLIIIGNDTVSLLLPGNPDTYSVPTILGDVMFKTNTGQISAMNDLMNENSDNWFDKEEKILVKRQNNGRYIVKLPFLGDLRPPDNYKEAVQFLDRLQRRLIRCNWLDTYESQLFKYIEDGHAEMVHESKGYFLPHHPVLRQESESTPLRIVFNGSFGIDSLNNLLWKGETNNLNVLVHLFKFRVGEFAVTADLSKAFLQINIDVEDRKFLKFLWKRNNKIEMYQKTVLPFGLVCSPAILSEVIKDIFFQYGVHQLADSVYMDDILVSDSSEINLFSLFDKAVRGLQESGFKVHKIKTNSKLIKDKFDATATGEVKILGINWNIDNDTLNICIPASIKMSNITKRELLSIIGQFFDPLGYIDPWKLKLRIIFKQNLALDWEDLLPQSSQEEIKNHLKNYQLLSCIKISRILKKDNELIGFSDASEVAYGYVIYMKDNELLKFIFGKTKISPNKKLTIVELELLALLELAKAIDDLHLIFKPTKITIFSDNKANLHRLILSPNRYKRQTANWLMKLITLINNLNIMVRHVNGDINPADIFSRNLTTEEFVEKIPIQVNYNIFNINEDNLFPAYKISAIKVYPTSNISSEEIKIMQSAKTIDELERLMKDYFSADADAIKKWNHFIKCAQSVGNVDHLKLAYIIDDDALIRIKTRIPDYLPYWIPKESSFAHLLIKKIHLDRLHSGVKDTVAAINDQYYIPNVNRLTRSIIAKCIHCQMEKKKAIKQPAANLPECRYHQLLPFEAVAVDLFGPLYYANGKKYYGLLLTCMATRMIKLEVIESLSGSATMNALNIIFCSVGVPRTVFSDNGTNFTRVNHDLQQLYKDFKGASANDMRRIEWKFSPPGAPWCNGCCERLVGVVKRCLRTYQRAFKSYREARMAFMQAEFVVNSRPFLQSDERWISPFEIVYGKRPFAPPEIATTSSPRKLVNQLKYTRERFESLWKSQYLNLCSQQQMKKSIPIYVGQIVMIPTEFKKRNDWPVGKVLEIYPGTDGIVRTVKLSINDKEYIKSVNGLVPLEEYFVDPVENGTHTGREMLDDKKISNISI